LPVLLCERRRREGKKKKWDALASSNKNKLKNTAKKNTVFPCLFMWSTLTLQLAQ
jgi:hypothetical protein